VHVAPGTALLHGIAGSPGTELEGLLEAGLQTYARFPPLVGRFGRIIASVSGPDDLLSRASEGLPEGAARPEAVAVRLRRLGVALEWGEPLLLDSIDDALGLSYERGRSALGMIRSDPSLTAEVQVGGWFDSGWRLRALRRMPRPARPLPGQTLVRNANAIRLGADLAFWRGVRAQASPQEWRRLAGSSYVALVYHRLAGEVKPGQERVDLEPSRFERQLRVLRLLGFRHLGAGELVAFHEDTSAVLPRRGFVVTVDDGFADCLEPLRRHARAGMQLYVSTGEIGGVASWLGDEPLLNWEDVRSLAAAGVTVGAHGRRHDRLSGLVDAELVEQLDGSLSDLRERLNPPLELLAYPYGDYDLAARDAASRAGFRMAFTTEKGRNGAGTDRYCLKRVSVHAADGALAILWKASTGEALPKTWQRCRGWAASLREAGARRA
jgi:hypothetical protein